MRYFLQNWCKKKKSQILQKSIRNWLLTWFMTSVNRFLLRLWLMAYFMAILPESYSVSPSVIMSVFKNAKYEVWKWETTKYNFIWLHFHTCMYQIHGVGNLTFRWFTSLSQLNKYICLTSVPPGYIYTLSQFPVAIEKCK